MHSVCQTEMKMNSQLCLNIHTNMHMCAYENWIEKCGENKDASTF